MDTASGSAVPTGAAPTRSKLETWSKIIAVVVNLALVVLGVFGLIGTFGSFDPFKIIMALYIIIFAFWALMAEFNCKWIFKSFNFLQSRYGRGFFYLFMGTLAASFGTGEIFQFIAGILLMCNGVFQVIVACTSPKQADPASSAGSYVPPSSGSFSPTGAKAGGYTPAGSGSAV